jgi:hypothetical protein
MKYGFVAMLSTTPYIAFSILFSFCIHLYGAAKRRSCDVLTTVDRAHHAVHFDLPVGDRYFSNFVAEVTFDLKHETSSPAFSVVSAIGEHLFGKGIYTSTGLTASHGSEDGDAGKRPRSGTISHCGVAAGCGRLG